VKRIEAAWVASFLVGFPFFVLGILVVPGLIIGAWGVAVATNWRGAADRFPKTSGFGPFRTTTTVELTRLIFAGFAIWGAITFAAGVGRLVR
jgi:hypothetical protein